MSRSWSTTTTAPTSSSTSTRPSPWAARFAISRPAVSRHLRVLRESGLVRDRIVGRQRFYELDASQFAGLIEWLDQFAPAAGWQRRLDALETEVYRTRREHRRGDAPDRRQENTA